MKITSRKSAKPRQATRIEVRDVAANVDYNYVNTGQSKIMAGSTAYLELKIRIPLDPNEFADTAKLRDRINNLHNAELLESE